MKLGILGHFGEGLTMLNGQTIKANNLVNALNINTDFEVIKIDSHGWSKKPIKLLKNIRNAFQNCDCMTMLPAHNGVRFFSPVFLAFRKKYKKKIYYDVIGGWLPEFLDDKPGLARVLKSFDGIWVETNTMKQNLEERGFSNVTVIPNFKNLKPLTEEELVYPQGFPLKLCIFSRVMKEKGIDTAVEAVKAVNEALGYPAFCLDIYGQVNEENKSWFEPLQEQFPSYVRHCGCVDSEKSVQTLQSYYALLFPTHFYTEGVPGTIIDGYAAGVPVISARWASFSDVVDEGITGLGYPFDDEAAFRALLKKVAQAPESLLDMRVSCTKKARKYCADFAISQIVEQLCK